MGADGSARDGPRRGLARIGRRPPRHVRLPAGPGRAHGRPPWQPPQRTRRRTRVEAPDARRYHRRGRHPSNHARVHRAPVGSPARSAAARRPDRRRRGRARPLAPPPPCALHRLRRAGANGDAQASSHPRRARPWLYPTRQRSRARVPDPCSTSVGSPARPSVRAAVENGSTRPLRLGYRAAAASRRRVDSRRWHTRVKDFAIDRQRDRDAVEHGWCVIRFVSEEVKR